MSCARIRLDSSRTTASCPSRRRRATAVQAAAAALRDAGFRVEPFRPRTLEPLRQLWWKFFVQCGAMFYAPAIRGREQHLSPIFNEFLGFSEALPPLTATELLNAWAELDLLRSKMLEEMSAYPVLLCPVASVPAFRHGEREWNVEGQTVKYLDAVAIHAVVQCAGRAGGGGAGWPDRRGWRVGPAHRRARLLRGPFKMRLRWASQRLWTRPSATGRLLSLQLGSLFSISLFVTRICT